MVDTSDARFEPFARTDRYGEAGMNPLPLLEKLRLGVMAVTLLPLRLLSCIICISCYYSLVRLTTALLPELPARRVVAFLGKIWCRMCLLALGFVSIRWVRHGKGLPSGRCGHREIPGSMSLLLSYFEAATYLAAAI